MKNRISKLPLIPPSRGEITRRFLDYVPALQARNVSEVVTAAVDFIDSYKSDNYNAKPDNIAEFFLDRVWSM